MSQNAPEKASPRRSQPTGRDLFRFLVAAANDPSRSGLLTARIVEAGDLTEFELEVGDGRIRNVRTPGNPGLLPKVIGGGMKAVEKKMNGRPSETKENAAALAGLLADENAAVPESEIHDNLGRLVARCLLPLFASDAPEAEWREGADGAGDDARGFVLAIDLDACLSAAFESGWRRGCLGAIAPADDAVPSSSGGPFEGLPGATGETCDAIYLLVDGDRSVFDVVAQSGRDEAEARYALSRLEASGHARFPGAPDPLEAAQKARREGRLDIALRYYREAEERDGNPDASLEMGRVLEIMGRTDEAREAFGRFADRCEDGGKLDDGLRHFRSAVSANPKDFDARRRLARLRAAAGETDAAIADLRVLAGEMAKEGDAAAVAGLWRAILGASKAPLKPEDYDRCIEALAAEPDRTVAGEDLRALKRRFFEERDTERALRVIEALRDLGEASPSERWEHANILIEAGRKAEAQRELEIVAAALRARSPEAGGPDHELLTGVYEMLVGHDPRHLEGRLFLARADAESGRRAKAVEHYEAVLDAPVDDSEQAAFDAALEEMIALDPTNARAVCALADRKAKTGESSEAVSFLATHVEAARTGGHAEAARRLSEKILELDPLHPEANESLARTYADRGDLDGAAACRRRLAIAAIAARRLEDAERWLRENVACAPDDPFARRDLLAVQEARADENGAAVTLAECGEAALHSRNFGIAEWAAKRLRRLEPRSAAAERIEAALREEARTRSDSPAAKNADENGAGAVKPAAKTGTRHASSQATARPVVAASAPAVRKPRDEDEPRVVVPEDSPEEDPFSHPPATVDAESFGKILSSLKSLKGGGPAQEEDGEEGEKDAGGDVQAGDDGNDEDGVAPPEADAETAAPPGSEESAPEIAPPAPATKAVRPTEPVPPEGDVEFSSILQSLKNLKLR